MATAAVGGPLSVICGAYYEDLLAAGCTVLDKCPICARNGNTDVFVGNHQHKPSCDTAEEPLIPINVSDFEVIAKRKLDNKIYGYYSSGANDMITLQV
jgi:hypothetical protein